MLLINKNSEEWYIPSSAPDEVKITTLGDFVIVGLEGGINYCLYTPTPPPSYTLPLRPSLSRSHPRCALDRLDGQQRTSLLRANHRPTLFHHHRPPRIRHLVQLPLPPRPLLHLALYQSLRRCAALRLGSRRKTRERAWIAVWMNHWRTAVLRQSARRQTL
ncbi:hypothetical protein BDV98DRAFT_120563 [Pterulicium gracile]|uniref:Uncharacterized protein n=1 Tax=Pterulicium gracile TaxID=1884261 RepID=A0A5C3QDK9_9AGAR|nr:hypothetical protein BDV98DRAFT_120563 [Pterula gracilis]